MIITPNSQTRLYVFNYFLKNLIDLYNKKKLPNKILLSGQKGIGKSTTAYHLINYIFSKDEEFPYDLKNFFIDERNKSFNLIINKTHSNFYLIDLINEKKVIEIAQIREMINYSNMSSFNNKPKIILIDNSEYLNTNSVNALLKIIEEPNSNVFFILIHNNQKKIKDTLKSRCLNFNLNLSNDDTFKITNEILSKNIEEVFNDDLVNYYQTPGELINLFLFADQNNINLKELNLKNLLSLLINEKYYNKNDFIKTYISSMIQFYFFKLLKEGNFKNNLIFEYSKFLKMFNNCKKFNLNYENLFLEFKIKVLNE